MARLPRDLHPGAWWLWAIGLAVAASGTTNPDVLLLLCAVAGLVVALRRSDHPWSASFRLYLWLALLILLIRVVFRVVFVLPGGHVLFTLPTVPLPHWVHGITLLGPVTLESLLGGLYDGMRLATIVVCVGAANSLADPKRLLKSMPPALYEIGTAVVVSVSVLPQLAESLRRVQAARALRGVPGNRLRRLRGVVVPVLEDALERSLSLAAAMDSRGYGRTGHLGRRRRRVTGALMLLGLIGICVGVYGLLDPSAPAALRVPMLLAGLLLALTGFVSAGRGVTRSRYRPDRWWAAEIGVALSGILVAVGLRVLSTDPAQVYPDVDRWPTLGAGGLVVLLGLAAALVAPPPRLARSTAVPVAGRPREEVAA